MLRFDAEMMIKSQESRIKNQESRVMSHEAEIWIVKNIVKSTGILIVFLIKID